MSEHEYLSVLISIIVGLGISHLLGGVGRIMVERRRVRVHWMPLVAAVFVFLAHVQWWWSTINAGRHLGSNFFGFLFFLLAPIVLYLLAVLVLPDVDDLPGTVSLREHYYDNHRWFFGLGALLPLLNALRNVFVEGAPLWNEDRPFEITGFVVLLGAALTRRPGYHAFAIVASIVSFVAMVLLTSLRPG
ncbi:MAG TPA: hypothetical protein VHG91_07810 [Longimicrobium sp.]|nr:hypothetical protein [Longimicrobium sp.]